MNSTTTLNPMAARVYGWAIIVAPLLLLASTAAYLSVGGGINDGVLGGTIGVWSCFAFAIAFVGILRLLEPSAPRIAPILTAVALMAFAGGGVAFNIQALNLGAFGNDFLETNLDGADAVGIFAFLPWGLFVPLTFVLTGIMLWRTRAVARWSSALFIASGIMFVSARPARIDVLALTADAVIVLALVPIGWAMLTSVRAAKPIS